MKKIKVKIKTDNNAIIPKYMTNGASGADIFSNENTIIKPGEVKLVSTGIFIEIPEDYECQIRPRSGLSYKHKILILNTPGTIDSDYRGEVKIIMYNLSNKDFEIKQGDRIAQMIFAPIVKAEFINDDLSSTERNDGGFGHTGIKNND